VILQRHLHGGYRAYTVVVTKKATNFNTMKARRCWQVTSLVDVTRLKFL
jgi:hypothetical protein